MEKIKVKNYVSFTPTENKKPYKVRMGDNGEELGIEIRGAVTQFDTVNENGFIFDKQSYDRCVAEYFEKNNFNIPVDVMHQMTFEHTIGRAEKFSKDEKGVTMLAFIPKGQQIYEEIKTKLDWGILQGFSNCGFITKGNFNDDGTVNVEDFQLLSVSLVSTPADITAKFIANKTDFIGFNKIKDENISDNVFLYW